MIYIYTLSTKEEPNKIRYIGKTNESLNRRLKRHLSKCYLKENIYKNNWLKSEIKNGNTPIIRILDEVKEDEWQFWEKHWIEQFKQWGFKLTNGTKGGEGIILTKEILKKRNSTNKKRYDKILLKEILKYNIIFVDEIWKGNIECPKCKIQKEYKSKNKGSVLNSLRRAEKEKRTCNSCKVSGDKNYFYGKKLNDGKLKRDKYGKKVLQYSLDGEIINEYNSIREASEKTKIDRKSISNCCKKIKHYNTAGGYKFKFK